MNINSSQSGKTFTLPPTGQIIMPFVVEAAVSSLPVFCASEAQAKSVDNLIEFLEDGAYQMINRCCPSTLLQSPSNMFIANQSFEDQISVPAESFLTMIGAISSQTAGFRFQMYDAGAQALITDGYVNANCMTGNFTPLPATGMLTSVSGNKNLFILPSPLSITSPGQLNVNITNLANATATIEMAFFFAAPIGDFAEVRQAIIGNSVLK